MITVNFVGAGLLPVPVASDKLFPVQLAPLLEQRGLGVRFLSITESPPGDLEPAPALTYLPRIAHRDDTRFYTVDQAGRPIGYHHVHGPLRQTAELGLTLLARRGLVRSTGTPTVYHWLDISTVLPALRAAVAPGAAIVASAQHWVPRGGVNDAARARSYSFADVVLAGTAAAARAIRAAGCRAPLVAAVPWGSKGVTPSAVPAEPTGPLRLLWTGYIRQIDHQDFLLAHRIALLVTERRRDVEFTFCFKPQFYEESLRSFERERVRVIPGDSSFVERLPGYDAMLSPTLQSGSTMAPPLAWIEALSAGLPILTTPTAGIEEIVADGRWGMVAPDAEALAARLSASCATAELRSMRTAARAEFERRYALEVVADDMERVYRWLGEGRAAGKKPPVEEAGW